MKTYYVAGIPFSDELYHSGTKGQKWGVRRFQNTDGTWTELGKRMRRVREGAGDFAKKAGEVIKTNAIKLRDAAHRRRIKKHPERMTDEELATYSQRLQMEKNYQQMLADTRMLRKKGKVDVAQLMQSFGNSALKGFGEKFGEKIGAAVGGVAQKKIEERHMDELDVLKRQNALSTERINALKNRRNEDEARDDAREWERGRVQREVASRVADRQTREQNRQLLAQERELNRRLNQQQQYEREMRRLQREQPQRVQRVQRQNDIEQRRRDREQAAYDRAERKRQRRVDRANRLYNPPVSNGNRSNDPRLR